MAESNAFAEVMTSNPKLLTITHEHDEGFTFYHLLVPNDYEVPKGTVGGDAPVDDDPELWEKIQVFIRMLDIDFDEDSDNEFLWCSEEAGENIKIVGKKDLP